MPPSTNRETDGTLSGSALRQPQRTSRVFMKGWNQSLIKKVVACAILLLALGSCSGGGSGAGSGAGCVTSNSPLTINSPCQGATLPPGPVLVTFDIQNSPASLSATQPRVHFHFYVDTDPVV